MGMFIRDLLLMFLLKFLYFAGLNKSELDLRLELTYFCAISDRS